MDVRIEAIRRRKRLVLLLVFLGIIAALIFFFRAVLAPFLVAIFVAYLIDPVVERMAEFRIRDRFRLGRGGSIVIIYLVLLACLYLASLFTIPALDRQIRQARHDLPKLRAAAEDTAQAVIDWYGRVVAERDAELAAEEEDAREESGGADGGGSEGEGAPEDGGGSEELAPLPPLSGPSHFRVKLRGGGEFTGEVSAQSETSVVLRLGERFLVLDKDDIERMEAIERRDARVDLLRLLRQNIEQAALHLDSALGLAFDFARTVVKVVYMAVLILMITAFLVIDKPRIVAFLHSVPPERHRETWRRLTKYVDRGLAGVIRGQLAICLVNGILTWLGLQFLGVRYSVLLGFVAGVFSLIPIFGTILSTIPIVLIAWGTGGLQQGLLALGWILLIHFVEANFLNPKIMGSASKIHPVVVIFALIAGEYAYGIAGALLAVPTASILQSCFKFFVIDRQLEEGEPQEAEPEASAA